MVTKTANGAFSAYISCLSPDTPYRFRAAGGNDSEDVYGDDMTFITQAAPEEEQCCFIATATHGIATAEEIDTLRAFRDEVLLDSTVGSQLVKWYYQTSPPVADFVSEHDVLRTLVRELLADPVVLIVEATETLWRN